MSPEQCIMDSSDFYGEMFLDNKMTNAEKKVVKRPVIFPAVGFPGGSVVRRIHLPMQEIWV